MASSDDTELRRICDRLAEECRIGRLVVFAGAGCSMSAGYPGWSDLMGRLLNECGIQTEAADLVQIASRLRPQRGKRGAQQVLWS